MIALHIAFKNLKELLRDLKGHAVIFLLPIAFMSIFAISFGKQNNAMTFQTAIQKSNDPTFAAWQKSLENLKNNKKSKLFNFIEVKDQMEGERKIKSGEATLLVSWSDDKIRVSGDPINPYYGAAITFIIADTNKFFGIKEDKVEIQHLIGIKKEFTQFELLAPGLIIYGIIIMIPLVAFRFAEIIESKQIFRYFTSQANAFDIILGYLMYFMVIALIQVLLLVGTAMIFGFRPQGSVIDIALITSFTAFFAIGFGLLLGSSTKKASSAGELGSFAAIITGFMSGSFIANIDQVLILGELSGHKIRFTDLFPSAYATRALKGVMLYGEGFTEIANSLAILGVSSLFILITGIVLYHYKQLKNVNV